VAYRGAQTAANFVEPDVAIVVDVDIAGDVPGIEEQQAAAKMGQGIAVTAWDVLCIPNQPLKELVVRTCERNKIPYQLTTSAGGGTDAAVIHKSNVGVPSISIGVPTRHIHSHVGIVDRTDLESSIRCLVGLVKVLDRETVDGLTTLD
jgi:putative aminopeptidase FrvX